MSPMPRGHVVRPVHVRFWEKVARRGPDDCWEWLGATNEHGYGQLRVDGRAVKAHRLAWMLEHPDAVLTPAEHVCHHCDNPPCVNPAHLYVGDYKTNVADKVRRGRQQRGPEHAARVAAGLPRGDDHWTHRDPEKAKENARHMTKNGAWNKGMRRG